MKIIRFFVVLGSAGVFLASPPAARPQALEVNPSTGDIRPDSLLNLAGPRLIGVLPSARLGTGTPSSATVLRGDGTWAGTIPTGNTITATNDLLMGDGAGNAVAANRRALADFTPVASQPVADFDFTRFAGGSDRVGRYLDEQSTTVAADSVNGSESNAGTLYAPKLTLQQTLTVGSVFGLYRGSVFRDSLPLSTLGNTHGIVIQSVSLGSVRSLPVISALDPAPNGSFTPNGSGSYTYTWTTESTVGDDGYRNVYVVEINTATEAATPFASRRRMSTAPNLRAVDNTPGSVFVSSLAANQWTAYIHPADSLAPGSGSYRYEVVVRFSPANWGSFDENQGDGAMGGLVLMGGSSGYGALGAPPSFAGDRLAFVHATTHNAVIGGGGLAHSVFYEGGNENSIMLAWYAGTATGLRWNLSSCLFYNNVGDRNRDMVIAHSGGSTSYDRGDVSDCAFLGGRWSDGTLHGTAFSYNNCLTGMINRVYVTGVLDMLGAYSPQGLELANSVLRDVGAVKLCGTLHDNIILNTQQNNTNGAAGFQLQVDGRSATNNLLWSRTTVAQDTNFVTQGGSSACTVSRNIVVLDPLAGSGANGNYVVAIGDGAAMTMDYNLVILLGGNLKCYGTPVGTINSWTAYLAAYPTLDQHSLFIDLTSDPRGLRAVFTDPANGDFRWAQTDVARQCATYCAANHVGPASVTSRWPLVPTVDDAVRSLTNL